MENIERRELALTRTIFVGSLLCSTIFLLLLIGLEVQSHERYIPWLIGSTVATCAGWFLIPWLCRRGVPAGPFLALAVLNLLLFVPELALRASSFRYESGIEFGYPRPSVFLYYQPDEKLFWKLDPSRPGVNSLGFPGDEIEVPKPPDVFRALFLGDSCTQQGYPKIVELFLQSQPRRGPLRFESTSLAVAGYTSHQGRVLAETYGAELEPDLVVVYFGWNDHWLAYGAIDSEKVVTVAREQGRSPLAYVHRRSRLVQAVLWIANALQGSKHSPLDRVRVPPDEYRNNLIRIRDVFAEASIPVIFVTAPTSHYRLGVPDYLVDQSYVRDKASAVSLHREYNEVVREIASGSLTTLVDLENTLEALPTGDIDEMFTVDGIHLTPTGMAVVAKSIADEIEARIAAGGTSP